MEKVQKALEEHRISFMSDYPDNEEHGKRRDAIVESLTPEEKKIYDLAILWYHYGYRDSFDRIVE